MTTLDPSSGAAPGAAGAESSPRMNNGFGSIGSGLMARNEDEAVNDEASCFRGRFQVLESTSGEAVIGAAARVRSTGGQYLTTTTDAEGFTAWVEREASEALAFDLSEPTP
ncbi:MAG: hypothetical protein U5L74_15580 [Ideonella sp.]|nr:hypothetical protein [Ideonella sp.]